MSLGWNYLQSTRYCLERNVGLEPTQPTWKDGMLTIEHQSRFNLCPLKAGRPEGQRKQSSEDFTGCRHRFIFGKPPENRTPYSRVWSATRCLRTLGLKIGHCGRTCTCIFRLPKPIHAYFWIHTEVLHSSLGTLPQLLLLHGGAIAYLP